MTQIEKVTRDGDVQFFQQYTRKDLKEVVEQYFSMLKDCESDARFSSQPSALDYYFQDCGLFWQLDDGTTGSIDIWGLDGKRPAINRIEKLHENGYGVYIGFFGKGIAPAYNEHYGDWDIDL